MIILTKFILGATILLTLTLIAFFIRTRTKRVESTLLLCQICMMLGWTTMIFLNLWYGSLLVEQFIFGFAALTLTFQFLFVSQFSKETCAVTPLDALIVLAGAIFTAISFIPQSLFTTVEITPQGYTILDTGPFSGYYALFVLFSILGSIILLAYKRKKAKTSLVRTQYRYLLWGFTVFFVINLLTNSLLPILFHIYFFNAIGPVFSLGFIGFIVYIIVYHEFLDFRLAIQRGAIYTTIFTSIAVLYITLLSLSTSLFGVHTEIAAIISCFVTATIGIFTVPKFDEFLRRKTDKIFFKNTYEYGAALEALSEILNKTLDQSRLIREIIDTCTNFLKAESIEIITVDALATKKYPFSKTDVIKRSKRFKNKVSAIDSLFATHEKNSAPAKGIEVFLSKHAGSICVPIYAQSIFEALMILGPKQSGERYSRKDISLIQTFALQAAVAFEKARLYKQVLLHSSELEQKVQERTHELETLQENQKRSMLTISHGLQTPLTVISGELYLLRNKVPKNELRAVEYSVKEVSRYIYNLLRLARLEANANQAPTTVESTNLSELTKEICETMRALGREEKVSIQSSLEPNILVKISQDDTQEIVSNLLSNALKYSDETRTNTITVHLTQKGQHGVLTIADTGIGIDQKNLSQIFDGYYRESENSTKKGTGLGLAIVKRLIENYRGTISVASTKGVGTTFTVTLPTE